MSGISAAEPVATITAVRAASRCSLVDDHAPLSVQAAAAAHERDAALLEPRQLTGVVQMVDHLVPPRAGPRPRRAARSRDPGTRSTSCPSSTGRSSAFEGMQA